MPQRHAGRVWRPLPDRRSRGLLVVVLAALVTVIGQPASAHDALVQSQPADGSVVTAPPVEVALTFSEAPLTVGAAVSVTGADGVVWSDGEAVVADLSVVQPLRQDIPSGQYAVEWRAVAADGHPVTGTLTFTVALSLATPTATAAPASPVASPTPSPAAPPATATVTATAAPAADAPGSSDTPRWVAPAIIVVAVAGLFVLGALRRRRLP
ncbi:MAG TPA: copper resistance CopC family protein [Actinotalea sp.]